LEDILSSYLPMAHFVDVALSVSPHT